MRETDWTKVLGWPGYRVYRHEINEATKTLKLWVRRKRWVPNCQIIYDKFHILQHASAAVDEVRRAELFRKGGPAREIVKGNAGYC
jgi:hypothetical protein